MNETKCEIVFVNSVGSKGDVYYSGQQITGSVVISVYDKQEIKEIKIKLLGIGQSQWTEQRRSFVGEETYLQHEIQLMRPSSNEKKSMYIVPGVYTYHFEYDLPNDLPTSCEEKYAAIRYMASVHIVHASLDEKVHTMPFTVIKPFNLNAESVFKLPAMKQRCVKFFQFFTLKMNQLTVTAKIPTTGYAPGQAISLQLDVNNQSDRDIIEFNIDLIKIVQCFDSTQKNQKKYKKILASTKTDGCLSNNCAIHMPEIVVPPVPSTDTVSSNILHISYELKVYGRFPKNNLKQLMKLPISIGTVPLYTVYRCVHFEDSAQFNHIEPFKYEAEIENMFQKIEKFSPVYPVYRIRNARKPRRDSNAII